MLLLSTLSSLNPITMKTKLKSKLYPILLLSSVVGFSACSNPEAATEETDAAAVENTEAQAAIEQDPAAGFENEKTADSDRIVISEKGMEHHHAPASDDAKVDDPQFMKLHDERFLPQTSDISGFMVSRDFEEVEIVETTEVVIPLSESQTLTAFNKKEKFAGQVNIVSSSATGEIDHITFTGKHHVDEYNVSAGLTGHEARKLRRELKHMAHNGQVYLYEEQSNVLYLMDSKNLTTGEEVTAAEVDTMTISAVIWKDSKHHISDGDGHDHAEGDGHNH